MDALSTGTIIDGRYRLRYDHREGWYGEVDVRASRLKKNGRYEGDPARHLDDETTIARFLREARATAQLRNRHVVKFWIMGMPKSSLS